MSELLIGYAELVDLGERFALSIEDRVLDPLSWSAGNMVNVENDVQLARGDREAS